MEVAAWIREELAQNTDEKYKEFHTSLVPGLQKMLGVRIPKLRELAKKAAKEGYREYVAQADASVYEELMLRGMMIGYAKLSMEEQKEELREFVPLINNWAVCDSCCATYKFMKKDRREWMEFLKNYLKRSQEYQVRFAVVCLLDFFVEEEFIDEVLMLLSGIKHEAYYVKMAVAWALSVCYVRFPQKTEKILEQGMLEEEVQRKTIQKIRESRRVSMEEKERLKQQFG